MILQLSDQKYRINFRKPIDISIPLKEGLDTVNAFYAPPVTIEPVKAGDFIGDVRQGGAVNFKNIQLNPHGNGTHTECVGHISPNGETIQQCLQQFFFLANLISVYPQKLANGDRVITKAGLADALEALQRITTVDAQALVIRSLPNDDLKLRTNYSGANPPYILPEAMQFIVNQGMEHLLVDLPSVDREEDGGKLSAHKIFWHYPDNIRMRSTITELIYIPNQVPDGQYLLNIMVTSLELDASPSKIVLYQLTNDGERRTVNGKR